MDYTSGLLPLRTSEFIQSTLQIVPDEARCLDVWPRGEA